MTFTLKPLALALALGATCIGAQADTLKDIYEVALKNDAKLKAAEATFKANQEVRNQALSRLLPQINASADYNDAEGESNSGGAPGFSGANNTESDRESYQLSLQQKLFDLNAWFTFQSGTETSAQAEAQFAFDQQDLIIRTTESYFGVLRALDNLEASKAEERATKRQLEQTQQRFDVGLIAITDVHEARAAYDSTVVRRLEDEGSVGTAYERLAVLTGQMHSDLWMLRSTYPVGDPVPADRAEWVQFALENNYQMKATQHGAEAARQTAKAKKMDHAPVLSARAGYDKLQTDGVNSPVGTPLDNPYYSDTEDTSWGLNLSVPIYSGGGISASRRQAYEQYNAALQRSIDTQRIVVQSTRAFHIAVSTDVQRVKARAQAIVSTQSALEATQAGYEVGTRNIVDVLLAQQRLYASIRDYANARYDYVNNMTKLKQLAGTLSPQDVYDINQWLIEPGTDTESPYLKMLNN